MNQQRVDIGALGAGILMIFASGTAAIRYKDTHDFIYLGLFTFLLGVGSWLLYSIWKEANAWSWNSTPTTFAEMPQGSWRVESARFDVQDNALYLVIVQYDSAWETLGDWGLSALKLTRAHLENADHERFLRGEQPIRIITTPYEVQFKWPHPTSGIHMKC